MKKIIAPWMTTHSRRKINPLALRPEDVEIEDIAHALANVNRFNGHAIRPISVAQHSVYASYLCEGTGYELQALLHDASEYLLGDVTKWLKQSEAFAGYREIEERTQAAIYRRYGCPLEDGEPVKRADKLLVRWEAAQAFGADFVIDDAHGEPIGYPAITEEERQLIGYWTYWSWEDAKRWFLTRYESCTKKGVSNGTLQVSQR